LNFRAAAWHVEIEGLPAHGCALLPVAAAVKSPKRSRRESTGLAPSAREGASRTRGSRYWAAGYPQLVALWHPTKNGTLQPDEVRFASKALVWWKYPMGRDQCSPPLVPLRS
jgi:hypothetical protein